MTSLRTIVQNCLNKGGSLSLRKDVMGVYGEDNPQDRSVLEQVNRIQNRPFIRLALVSVRPLNSTEGQNANLQRDLDNTNTIYQNECDTWVYPVGSQVIHTNLLGINVLLDQDDCTLVGHSVSTEEDALFNLGRNMGADIVAYYINGDVAGFAGCAAHPPDRRGFWVGAAASPWTFAHELTHVVGDNRHTTDNENLMFTPTANIQNPPPDLTNDQCTRIHNDEDVESC